MASSPYFMLKSANPQNRALILFRNSLIFWLLWCLALIVLILGSLNLYACGPSVPLLLWILLTLNSFNHFQSVKGWIHLKVHILNIVLSSRFMHDDVDLCEISLCVWSQNNYFHPFCLLLPQWPVTTQLSDFIRPSPRHLQMANTKKKLICAQENYLTTSTGHVKLCFTPKHLYQSQKSNQFTAGLGWISMPEN